MLPEKQIIEFIEKSLGSKLNEDFTDFYKTIEASMSESKFEQTKDLLLEFISGNPKETRAIYFYLECLIQLNQFEEVDEFIKSLENELLEEKDIKKVIKKFEIIKKNQSGPSIDELLKKLDENPEDIELVVEIADKYFSLQEYESSMNILLEYIKK